MKSLWGKNAAFVKTIWGKFTKEFKFTWFEWTMIAVMVLACVLYGIFNPFKDTLLCLILNIVSSISGVICVILCAKGKLSTYIWGVVNVVAYIVICWQYEMWGDFGLNALIFLPTQVIGWIMWDRHLNKDVDEVKSKKMTVKQWIMWGLISIATSIGLGYVLSNILPTLNGSASWLDGFMTVLSIWANVLMVKRYSEQWPLWIAVDMIAVVKWGIQKDWIMAIMYTVYLVNAVYGYAKWLKMNKVRNIVNE